MDKNEVFESLPVPAALRRMILPSAISQIIILIYNMADTFYIGRTNNPYMLAGASLILPVFNMLLCLASLAGVGGRHPDLPPAGHRRGNRGPQGQHVQLLAGGGAGGGLRPGHGGVHGAGAPVPGRRG